MNNLFSKLLELKKIFTLKKVKGKKNLVQHRNTLSEFSLKAVSIEWNDATGEKTQEQMLCQ